MMNVNICTPDQHEMPEQRVTEMEDRYKTEEHHQFSESLPYAEPADYCEPVSIYRQVTEDTNTPGGHMQTISIRSYLTLQMTLFCPLYLPQ